MSDIRKESMILNAAVYQFVHIQNLPTLREELRDLCRGLGLKGTILLSPEGFNSFLAGSESAIEEVLQAFAQKIGGGPYRVKRSWTETQPFSRMLVRIKKEIISMGMSFGDRPLVTAPHLTPEELREWMRTKKDFVFLDTRNDYEIRLGKFEGAMELGIQTFRQFPEKLKELAPQLKDKTVVMYCTGGIRCEKATAFAQEIGMESVYQIEDGILGYFERCGSEGYQGDCFVFDYRVAVGENLSPTHAVQCFECRNPLTPEEQKSPDYQIGKHCPYCVQRSIA